MNSAFESITIDINLTCLNAPPGVAKSKAGMP
jgi:hypothetical protein